MASKPGFAKYVTAAFNARPSACSSRRTGSAWRRSVCLADESRLLGARRRARARLSAHARHQPALSAHADPSRPLAEARDEWNARIERLTGRLEPADRKRYEALAERCRSIIDLQTHGGADVPHGHRGAGRQPRPPLVDVPAAAGRAPHDRDRARRARRRDTLEKRVAALRAQAGDESIDAGSAAQPRRARSTSSASASSSAKRRSASWPTSTRS